ncbi:MAG: hypothetical protein ACPGSD_07680 [Flavobacteriales bacterium]
MEIIKSIKNQTLFDIAIQMYGHIEGVIWLLEDNPETSFETIGSTIFLRKDMVRKDVVKYLQEKRISIATQIAKNNTEEPTDDEHSEFTNEFNFEFN